MRGHRRVPTVRVVVLGKCAVGIDIGGTKLRLGLVDNTFIVRRFMLTQEHRWLSPTELVDLVALSVKDLLQGSPGEDVVGIGVGYPGPICFPRQSTFSYSNLRDPDWKRVPLADMVKRQIGLPVLIENDANLVGLAESHFGAGKDYRDFVYLTISTGTGGAIFINRRLYRGFLGSAGEFGHMVVDIDGPQCKCGNNGCLMSLLSGLGIEQFVQREPACKDLFAGGRISDDCAKQLVELLHQGVPQALDVVRPLVQYMKVAFLNIIHILNPEAIIVGGTLGRVLIALFLEEVRKYLRANLPEEVVNRTCIREAELGEEGGVLGAAVLVFESLSVEGRG